MEEILQFVPLLLIFIIFKIIFKWKIPFKRNVKINRFSEEIPINDTDNIILKLNEKRDEIYQLFYEVSLELDISIECIKSSSFDLSTWVACKVSSKKNDYMTRESYIDIELLPMPFHIYDIPLVIELTKGNRMEKFENVIYLTKDDIRKILQMMLLANKIITFKPKQYSSSLLFFWRPQNKLIKEFRCNFFKPQDYLGLSLFKITTGKPPFEPRALVKLDSWQTVVFDIGYISDTISAELESKFSTIKEDKLQITREKVWYWGINGREEREQLVCIFNRAYVIVHIYSYGENLYIGWDANLNYARWEEYKVGEACFGTGLYSTQPIWEEVNEYDLNDTNFLLETVHSFLRQIIKQVMQEKKIDQEIDFNIVRESRKEALKAEKPKNNKRNKFKRLS